jgi:hypothetical protein
VAYKGIAKVQHYVPQFLLRNFGNGKKDQLYVFDKQMARNFRTNAKNVASESRFYDFDLNGESLTLEPFLSELEGKTKQLFQRVLEADNLSVLSNEDRSQLSVFLSIQFTRTKCFREQRQHFFEMFAEKVRGIAESLDTEEDIDIPDRTVMHLHNTKAILDAPKDLAVHFANKVWMLLQTERKRPFIIGDNPLAMYNMNDYGPYGNLGLAVPGIEIYFPLSPTRALALWCLSSKHICREGAKDLQMLSRLAPNLVAEHIPDSSGIEQIWAAMETGRPLIYKPENVVHFNSLQVMYAERFVFSCTEDFELASEMISSHPKMRTGPRMQIN